MQRLSGSRWSKESSRLISISTEEELKGWCRGVLTPKSDRGSKEDSESVSISSAEELRDWPGSGLELNGGRRSERDSELTIEIGRRPKHPPSQVHA
jgi:hypothetical protein